MIRRWSYINQFDLEFSKITKFEKRFKIKVFRTAVNYKKFTFKFTKFKRKSLIRNKHSANWLIYTNVIKLWSEDYMFNKHHAKFQFFNKLFANNFLFYDFNFVKNRNENFFYNFNFFISTLSKKSYFYFNKITFNQIKYFSLTFAWFGDKPISNKLVVPYFNEWDNIFYPVNLNKATNQSFNFSELLDFFFFLFLQKNIEIYKILTILFYYKILKR